MFTGTDYYYDTDIEESIVKVKILNPKVYVLTESKIDSTYLTDFDDTIGSNITHYDIETSYPNGQPWVVSTVASDYVKGLTDGDTINADDLNWSNSDEIILRYYRSIFEWEGGEDTNAFVHHIHEEVEQIQGSFTSSDKYIGIKFDNGFFTKLGYLKLTPYTFGATAYAKYYYFRMHN